MPPGVIERTEKILVWLLAACLALPLLLSVLLLPRLSAHVPPWLLNQTLSGVQPKPETVTLSHASVLSARYQDYVARNYGARFIGREMMIRLGNELYLRAFRVAPSGVLVGRNMALCERVYAEEYCLQRGDANTLLPMVNDLRRLQDFCEEQGTAFALIITPSKAAIYPEDLPAAWQSCYVQKPRYYDLLLPLLDEKQIHYVNGHHIAAGMKRTERDPVFPSGGTHWSDPLALATANALLDVLAGQGVGMQRIQNYTLTQSQHPGPQDRDLSNLINIVSRWNYPVTNIAVKPAATSASVNRPNMVVIGGSFTRKLLTMLDASRQFSELDFYFYYHNSLKCWSEGKVREVGTPTPPVNFETDVFAADSLVLECNEQTLHTPAAHLTAFLHDALASIPAARSANSPFHYEAHPQAPGQ